MMPSSPSQIIDKQIAAVKDWRGVTMAKLRKIIHDADPDIVEELKWKDTPVFSHDGLVCLFKPFKDKMNLTFSEGAPLPDPEKLFNSMPEGNKGDVISLKGGRCSERCCGSIGEDCNAGLQTRVVREGR